MLDLNEKLYAEYLAGELPVLVEYWAQWCVYCRRITVAMEQLAKKYRIFIVSNCECGYPELVLDKMDLGAFVQDHLCFGDTRTTKGQTILTLMKKHNLKNCIYVGDTQGDYEATQEAGIPFVWASYGFGNPTGYDKKIDTFADLLNL